MRQKDTVFAKRHRGYSNRWRLIVQRTIQVVDPLPRQHDATPSHLRILLRQSLWNDEEIFKLVPLILLQYQSEGSLSENEGLCLKGVN